MQKTFDRTIVVILVMIGWLGSPVMAEGPLRVFWRSGEGAPEGWRKLLAGAGAEVAGSRDAPKAEELERTDVVVLGGRGAADFNGVDRENFERYLERGGGVVAIHEGVIAEDGEWLGKIAGGAWADGKSKRLGGRISLYFTDRENPITEGLSNFDLGADLFYDLEVRDGVEVLAAAYTPKPKEGGDGDGMPVNVYDIQPQVWSYVEGERRAFVCVPGGSEESMGHESVRALILRGVAWAGKAEDVGDMVVAAGISKEALRYPEGGPTRPEKAAAKIELHPEFNLSLVAAEPLINKVLNVDWDARGRMWVVESPEYPNGLRKANTEVWKDSGSVEPGVYERQPQDRISILTDTDGDGRMDAKQVFADGLELATGFVFHRNGVIVTAAPDIWFFDDTDGDGKADRKEKLYSGLGTRDTHAVINNPRWGTDGWIYATHGYSAGKVKALNAPEKGETAIGSGVVRFRPDGTVIEMFSSKGGNCWGLEMTADGQCFWTQPTSGTVLFHTLLPERIMSLGKIPGTEGFNGMISGEKTFPLMSRKEIAYRQIDMVGSYTAASGCAIYEGGAWPEKWAGGYFTSEPTINIVSHYVLEKKGASYEARREEGREKTEFVRSSDLWFRPIVARVGPDGALYVVDFYNQAVVHNDTRGPAHGPANAAVRPDRDHYFGRIWKIAHEDARELPVVVLDGADEQELREAMDHPAAHVRMTARRLLREEGKDPGPAGGSIPEALYEKHAGSREEAGEAEGAEAADDRLIADFLDSRDDWSRSALIAASHGRASRVVRRSLEAGQAAALEGLVENLVPGILREGGGKAAAELIGQAAAAPDAALELKGAIVREIGKSGIGMEPVTEGMVKGLAELLRIPEISGEVLPLAARLDKGGELSEAIDGKINDLKRVLGDDSAMVGARVEAAIALAGVGREGASDAVLKILTSGGSTPSELGKIAAGSLGSNGQVLLLARNFAKIDGRVRAEAFDEILKRPEASMEILRSVDSGGLDPELIGPGNIGRLRSHPDKAVSMRAAELRDKLVPGAKGKSEIFETYLPQVTKAGDAANGKKIFEAACAVCHHYEQGQDARVGPSLTGMGTQGAAELLVHIIDPNREVDPSYWQWNLKTKDGETLSGVIVSENPTALTLRNQGGDREIRRAEIASRENTHRSLMPEGLEGLGVGNIRDILTYMVDTDGGDFRTIDLRESYTADSRTGLFSDAGRGRERIGFHRFGGVRDGDVPYYIMDPEMSSSGRNLVVLRGGSKGDIARNYPEKVEIGTELDASRIHIMGGIAGGAYPISKEKVPVLKVTLEHEDGGMESKIFLNGEDVFDQRSEKESPDEGKAGGIVSKGQMRIMTMDVEMGGRIKKIILESGGNEIAPVVVGMTAELRSQGDGDEINSSGREVDISMMGPKSTEATGQEFVAPKEAGAVRVLLVGAGEAHHFPRDFISKDREILSAIPGADVIGTMNLEEALERMPEADVLVFSGNHKQWGSVEFQKALGEFPDGGKGILLLHAATWRHPWEGYNARFAGGGTMKHGKGVVEVRRAFEGKHPLLEGVPDAFEIRDESYHFEPDKEWGRTVLLENAPDGQSPETYPALWAKDGPGGRIVGYTHGHDDVSHGNPAYQTILKNAVEWLREPGRK